MHFTAPIKTAAVAAVGLAAAVPSVLAATIQDRAQFDSAYSHHASMMRRSVTGNGNDLDGQSYDYIIVGGGLAGLTVASRLSEVSNVTVAVIEAGGDVYGADQNKFLVPTGNLYDSAVKTQYDWQWQTSSQAGANGRNLDWPRGKVLGGSSAINGLYLVRSNKAEHDSLASLISAPDIWGWDNIFRAMKKSETFVPPTGRVRNVLPDLRYNEASHGSSGPIHYSWPGAAFPTTNDFLQSMANTGTPISDDAYGGSSSGAFVATSAINPQDNWHRSFARNGYLDPAQNRPNLHVLTGHQVTRVLLDSSDPANVRATGVQYAASRGSDVKTVNANREVIVSGGSVNTPQILQLSGIGNQQHLASIGVDTVIDLPGVGENLNDHVVTSVAWAPQGNVEMPAQGVTGNAVADSYVNAATGYTTMNTLLGNYTAELVQQARAQMAQADAASDARDEVKRAWNVTREAQLQAVFSEGSAIGAIELLWAYVFGSMQVQVALQHPMSRGYVRATSNDPFTAPEINPNVFGVNFDLALMREGLKLARRVGNAQPLSNSLGNENSPGTNVQADNDFETYARNSVGTEYHPSSTSSMLPRGDGGVVDANLMVYGTSNLRVVDASILSSPLSCHLMAPLYGAAEVAAEIIVAHAQGRGYTGSAPPRSDNDSAGQTDGAPGFSHIGPQQ
ncbi:Glucose dehydrogenase/choline dehydrogenase/mandelonitrile lyase (GMC oxidoreductase family) [Ceraceosorus bombacis]|uniref:Glucose dehydrogenase/choline dehydrogenase/mandelonitrile lyase (GMC oxidoreductase family) n=1 Tax=Ceraceosorus bombacis TaxID=401625 RepID=A0A0N7LB96_9BASI|nr:Glucose dehydrogenase/choline dehydrogenase/mandelonitrile lyase (GMC oxidoreductase family) [Ceraceosorus bombacis]